MSNSTSVKNGMGWIPDLPDRRDFTTDHKHIRALLCKLPPGTDKIPSSIDLRFGDEGEVFFSKPGSQGTINSSTAFAVSSLLEYLERRFHARTYAPSQLFLYKVTRSLRNKRYRVAGDTGADLRTTFKAAQRFGVPPEEYWPYDVENFDKEPPSFVYELARPIPDFRYFRVSRNENSIDTLEAIKAFLVAGFPLAFGFSVPSSISAEANVYQRGELDELLGGQAVVAIGYDDNHFGRNLPALKFLNSWGCDWGDNGVGYLPFSFIEHGLATNFIATIPTQLSSSSMEALTMPSVTTAYDTP